MSSTKIKITGAVSSASIKEAATKKGEEFSSVNFIVTETGVEHPNKVMLNYFAMGEKKKYVDGFFAKAGDGAVVEVEFNIGVKEFNGKQYGENKVWNVKVLEPVEQSVF